MPWRQPIEIRDAVADDALELIDLWRTCLLHAADEGLETYTQQTLWREPSEAETREAIAFNAERNGRRLLVGTCDGTIVSAAAADITTLTPISMSRVMLVSDLQVAPEHRRRSVASAMLAALAAHAEESGCDMVVSSIPAHAKEPNRYLTKLGFNQIAVLRAIPLGKLTARLATKTAGSRETGRLVAVRRTLRRRHAIG